MGLNILKLSKHNLWVYALIGLQLLVLISIATVLISAIGRLSLLTAASTTLIFLIGMPILILSYSSAGDRKLKAVLFGLTGNIAILSISGIIWYVLSPAFGIEWLIAIAKALMIIAYIPLIYALVRLYSEDHKKLGLNAKVFIGFVNASCSLGILIVSLSGMLKGNAFNIAVYTLSSLADLAVIALAASLLIVNSKATLRYIFSMVFCMMLLSLAGDSLSLMDALSVAPLSGYAGYFYDFMLIFTSAALLIYFFYQEFCDAEVAEAKKRLSDARHAMEDLIMQMPDAACVFSAEGDAMMANDGFLRVFRTGREDIIGKFNLFSHSASLQCCIADRMESLKKGEAIVMENVRISLKDGLSSYISFKIFPTFSGDGEISGFIAICDDVTSKVKAGEELRNAKALVELYIDLLGHDINNMNQRGIGYLEMALGTIESLDSRAWEDKGHLRQYLSKALEAMWSSSGLIDNVKKLRRTSEGDMSLYPVDLGKVLLEVIAEHSQSPAKKVDIRYEIIENAMVNANELLKDVFSNLVSNSIKHSGDSVRIGIRLGAADGTGKKRYLVVVEDDGPGIPDEMKPIIFDRLSRGRKKTGGNGVGLYLVKALVDKFGGTISVEDRVPGDRKQGTRFIVTLPAA
jgi:PAS domain S-box-containing protein